MPIVVEAYDDDPLCNGHIWKIADEDGLAQLVAKLIAGDWLQVEAILAGAGESSRLGSPAGIESQVRRLAVEAGDHPRRWHRDGWLFQLISWVAATIAYRQGVLIRQPQMIPADKGFDGILVELESDGEVVGGIVICEDKATVSPRRMIQERVWPALRELESGSRDAELVSEVSTILSRYLDSARVRTLISNICWEGVRRYRVAITVSEPHEDPPSRSTLLQGYDSYVVGPSVRRRGDAICIPDLRQWMEGFASRVAQHLRSELTQRNV